MISQYQKYSELLVKLKKAKIQYYKPQLLKYQTNTAEQWTLIKEILRKKHQQKTQPLNVLSSSGKNISNPTLICNEFNKFFTEIW